MPNGSSEYPFFDGEIGFEIFDFQNVVVFLCHIFIQLFFLYPGAYQQATDRPGWMFLNSGSIVRHLLSLQPMEQRVQLSAQVLHHPLH